MTATLYGPEFFVGRSRTVTESAAVVAPITVGLLQPRSVLDIGCGQGEWMDAFQLIGVPYVVGIDIAAPDRDCCRQHDLTEPLDLHITFDLVVSLEVGEHLPQDAADIYVDTLTRHSDTILFSAAVPGQEGTGHINCQPHEYWAAKFEERGYRMSDPVRPLLAGDGRVSPWYRDNILLFTRPRG